MNIFEGQVKIDNDLCSWVFFFFIVSTFNRYLTGLEMYTSIHLAFERKCAHSGFFGVLKNF